MGHIFISYSHTDRAYVHLLGEALQQKGFDVWLDDRLDYGSTWPHEIQKWLDSCSAFILVMTPRAFDSLWVQNELSRAQRKQKPIFPLLLEGEIWLIVESIQYVEVNSGKLPPDSFYERLAEVAPRIKTGTGKTLGLSETPEKEADFPPKHALGPVKKEVVQKIPEKSAPLQIVPESSSSGASRKGKREKSPLTLSELALVMNPIPAGKFQLGSKKEFDPHALKGEFPAQTLDLPAFSISKDPITNQQYALFCRETKHPVPSHWGKNGLPEKISDHPVVNVSWNEAVAFCDWLTRRVGRSFRLPSEPEWEKSARGTDGRLYPWGNEFKRENCHSSGGFLETFARWGTASVRMYVPEGDSVYGVSNLSGNVWEWCASVYGPYPYQGNDFRQGRELDGPRVLRGGSFNCSAYDVRCAARYKALPSEKKGEIGFRVASS